MSSKRGRKWKTKLKVKEVWDKIDFLTDLPDCSKALLVLRTQAIIGKIVKHKNLPFLIILKELPYLSSSPRNAFFSPGYKHLVHWTGFLSQAAESKLLRHPIMYSGTITRKTRLRRYLGFRSKEIGMTILSVSCSLPSSFSRRWPNKGNDRRRKRRQKKRCFSRKRVKCTLLSCIRRRHPFVRCEPSYS